MATPFLVLAASSTTVKEGGGTPGKGARCDQGTKGIKIGTWPNIEILE
jgi:hypothetical protein